MPKHDLDAVSLVAGVAFGGSALVFLLDRWTGMSGRWIWPILLIVIGVAGLVATRRGHATSEPVLGDDASQRQEG
jgi:hypothetical protein